jgi:predicted PurR-regulated permease PerM
MSVDVNEADRTTAAETAITFIRVDAANGGQPADERGQPADQQGASGCADAGDHPSGEAEEDSPLNRRIATLASGVWFCGGLLTLYTLYIGRNLFVPVTIAVFAYLTLRPLVRGATKLGVPAPLSAAAVMVALAMMIGILFYLVAEPAKAMLNTAPESLAVARGKLSFIFDRLESVNEATEDISDTAAKQDMGVEEPIPVQIKQSTWTTTSPILTGTGNILSLISIAAALLYFLMASGDQLLRNLTGTIPTFSSKRRFLEVVENVQDALSSYLGCVTAINACLGVAIGTAMWYLQMPAPLMWGVAAMLLNFLPIFGAVCGIAAAFFIAIVSFEQVSYAFLVAGTYAALTTFEGQFITPSVLGKSMRLSSAVVFLSIVIWGWMWGIAGIFLAVPILLTLAMVSEKVEALAPVAAVISGSAPQTPTHKDEHNKSSTAAA